MKITDPDIIRTGEKDLINAVKDDLDWDAVTKIIKNRINTKAFESKGGEIIVLNGQIAFRIDLELKMNINLMFDRDGNYIPNEKSEVVSDIPDDASSELSDGIDMDSDFGLEFTNDEDDLELNDDLDNTSNPYPEKKSDSQKEAEVFDNDNDIDDDIDDILEETREIWKQKK